MALKVKTYNNVQANVTFSKASSRVEINPIAGAAATENIALTLGKISKWYDSLVPTGGSSGKILVYNSSGTAKWNDPLHPTITKSADTTSTVSPAHGGTFTTVDSVTRDANGHVTKINTKTVTLPSDQNTDTKVTQTNTTTSADYRILFSENANDTTETVGARKNTGLKYNPNSGMLYAPRITLKSATVPAINVDLDTLKPTAGQNVNILGVSFKNTDGSAIHTTYPIGIIGNDATGAAATYNSGVRLGSTSGITIIAAGESSTSFASAQTKYDEEQLYLVSDGGIFMYTNMSNEGALGYGPWRVSGFTTNPSSGQVVITDGTAGGIKSSGYTIATSVPSGAVFTDTKVTQTAVGSTYTNYRPLVISASNSDSAPPTATTVTDGTFITSSIYCQPSSGSIYATKFVGPLQGNADTATKWKTARTLTIGSTGKSVDGSGNVSWSLSEIGAASSSHTHNSLYAVSSTSAVPSTTLSAGQFKVFYNVNAGLSNNMPASNNANFIIQLNKHSGNYDSQLGFSSNGNIYYRNFNAETIGSQSWRTILDSGNLEAEAEHLDSYSAAVYTSIPINPIAYPLSGFHRSNKLAFMPAANVTIEYSTDGGSTWVNYGASNDVKRDLFINKRGSSVNIGPSSGDRTTSMMTRVIVETDGRDAVLDRFLIQLDSGYHNVAVDIYVAHVDSPTTYTKATTGNSTGTWAYEYEINLKHNADVYYRFSNSYYKKIAFYFRYTSVKDANKSSSSSFCGIMGFTGSYWGGDYKSHLANYDHLYIWDRDQNVTFPANVTAPKFTGPLNVSRVTKDSKTFPGANKAIIEEYVGGANYNLPSSQYYHIISIQGPDTKYGTQLALGMTTLGAYYRNYNNQTWSDWKSIINSNTTYGISGAYGSNNNTWVTTITAGGSGTTSTVPTSSTSAYGITKLYNGVDSTSTSLAATANAVKTAYDKGNHSHPYLPDTTKYAGSSSAGGAATSANKLNTNAGDTNRPVYFSGGIPVRCDTPVSGKWWNGVPYVGNNGVLEIGKYIDFHGTDTTTADYDYRILAGSSWLDLASPTTQNKITVASPDYSVIQFQTTKTGYTATQPVIYAYPLTTYGLSILFQSGGNTVIGGGESASTLYTNDYDSMTTAENESLYLASDSSEIHLITNAQSYGTRKVLKVADGQLVKSGGQWISARDTAPVYANKPNTQDGGYYPAWFAKTKSGGWSMGVLSHSDNLYITYTTDEDYSGGTNNNTYNIQFQNKTGTVALTSDIPAVNNASLTLKGAGTTVTTFTANASTNQSLDIVAGSNVTITPDATNHKITIASSYTNTDTKVNVTLGTTTKAYLLGTSTTPTSTAQGVTSIADTGVYLDTTAGTLTATTFKAGNMIEVNNSSGMKVTANTASSWARGIEYYVGSTYASGIGGRGDANTFGYLYMGKYDDNIARFYQSDKSTYFYGTVHLKGDLYDLTKSAMNCHNSNITGINSLIFEDLCDNANEGIMFYRSATPSWDVLWAKNGLLYFSPNHPTDSDNLSIGFFGTSSNTDAWSSIGVGLYSTERFQLKIIHTGANNTYPSWMGWAYSAAIAFGGVDTKGVVSVRYDAPDVMFIGGQNDSNHTKPNWNFGISGTSGTTYNLANMSNTGLGFKTLSSRTALDTTSGSFIFSAAPIATGDTYDWVGFQADAGNDRFQLIPYGSVLLFRENDDSTPTSAGWNNFQALHSLDGVSGSNGITVDYSTSTIGTGNDKITYTYGAVVKHSNNVTAGTAKGDNSKTLTFGGTFTIPSITYDANGHITTWTTTTMTMPSNPNTNTTYTLGTSGNNVTLTPSSGSVQSITVPFATSTYEANLIWGDKNFSGSNGVIDTCLNNALGANRFELAKAAGITIDDSSNSGSSWTTATDTDSQKRAMFCSSVGRWRLVGNTSTAGMGTNASKYMTRVTLDSSTGSVYSVINKLMIHISTNGSTGCWMAVQIRSKTNADGGNDLWKTWNVSTKSWGTTETTSNAGWAAAATHFTLAGWSGWNVLNIAAFTLGNSNSSHYKQIRFIFGCASNPTPASGSGSYSGIQLHIIQGYGGFGWSVGSQLANNGHLYTYDSDENAYFPADIYVGSNKVARSHYNLNTAIGQGSTAANTKTFFDTAAVPTTDVSVGYNSNGAEYGFLFSKGGNNSYGTVLRWGYGDTYIRMLRKQGGTWKSTDWEKISAGYADKAGSITTVSGTSTGERPVFFAYLGDNSQVVYNTNFTYNPSGGVLQTEQLALKSGSYTTTIQKGTTTANRTLVLPDKSGGIPVANILYEDDTGAHSYKVADAKNYKYFIITVHHGSFENQTGTIVPTTLSTTTHCYFTISFVDPTSAGNIRVGSADITIAPDSSSNSITFTASASSHHLAIAGNTSTLTNITTSSPTSMVIRKIVGFM